MTIPFSEVAAKLVDERAAGNWRASFTVTLNPMTVRVQAATADEIACVLPDGQMLTLRAADVSSIAFVAP